jgi:hypothetical protein
LTWIKAARARRGDPARSGGVRRGEEETLAKVIPFSDRSATEAPLVPYFLTDRAARRHGVDLAVALTTGLMSAEDFRAILSACRICVDAAGAEGARADPCAPTTPESCANRAILDGLRGIV